MHSYTPEQREFLQSLDPKKLMAFIRMLNGGNYLETDTLDEARLKQINEDIMGDTPLPNDIIQKILHEVIENPRVTEDGKITDEELDWDDHLLSDADIIKPITDPKKDEVRAPSTPLDPEEPAGIIDIGVDKDHPVDEVLDGNIDPISPFDPPAGS